MYKTRGRHIVADFFGCKSEDLDDERKLIRILRGAAKKANSTILQHSSYKFTPQGVTAVVLLEESHISCHTYPEFGFIAVDIYTCGKQTKPSEGLKFLRAALKPKRVQRWFIKRGDR